jgi:GNAT superfamily N-acetyltransferase
MEIPPDARPGSVPCGADGYAIASGSDLMDARSIHAFLCAAYWSPGIPLPVIEKAIAHSVCVGLFHDGAQVGFARAVTDRATFAYLADVYVLGPHRGQGLARRMLEVLLAHPDLQGLRRFLLATRDAHGVYRRFGFRELSDPSRMMEIRHADPYRQA